MIHAAKMFKPMKDPNTTIANIEKRQCILANTISDVYIKNLYSFYFRPFAKHKLENLKFCSSKERSFMV